LERAAALDFRVAGAETMALRDVGTALPPPARVAAPDWFARATEGRL